MYSHSSSSSAPADSGRKDRVFTCENACIARVFVPSCRKCPTRPAQNLIWSGNHFYVFSMDCIIAEIF